MKRTVTWLHISDLHLCEARSGYDAGRVLDPLILDLRDLEQRHGLSPDFIFCTGDLAFGQLGDGPGESIGEQFTRAQEVLERIRTAFACEVALANVFLVPGNHDVNRRRIEPRITSWLSRQKNPDKICRMISEGGDRWRQACERLADYRAFLRRAGYDHLLTDPDRLTYGAVRQVNGLTIGIAGFNSAWSCRRSREHKALWMGAQQQIDMLKSRIKDSDFNIALVHHPPSWLVEQEAAQFSRDLDREFSFCLHGHEHEAWLTLLEGHTRIAAAAAYESSRKENGYNIVRLDPASGRGEVWLRRFEARGAGWVPAPVAGRTDERGCWSLELLHCLARSPLGNKLVRELASGATAGRPPVEEDLSWFAVEPIGVPDSGPEIKTPTLQALKTARQITNHFILVPKIAERLEDWLGQPRDLLFLGLPFCGKTTLLTFLELELAKRGNSLVIRLRPRSDLTPGNAREAAARLRSMLEEKLRTEHRPVVLILDNAHLPERFEIARVLMREPRRWWLWSTARPRGLAEIAAARGERLWRSEERVDDACDLISGGDLRFFIARTLGPALAARGEAGLAAEVESAIQRKGSVPIRFLVQAWALAQTDRGDLVARLESEPTGVESVLHSVWPQSRPGLDALVIVDLLKGPSWELLAWVLASIDGYGRSLAAATLTRKRETLALFDDPERTGRAAMYDPVRERVRAPGNLTRHLEEQIWAAVAAFLSDPQPETGPATDDLVDSWLELASVATGRNRREVSVACLERAAALGTGRLRAKALLRLSLALASAPEPDWAGAERYCVEALKIGEVSPGEWAEVLFQLGHCLRNGAAPRWAEAEKAYWRAYELFTAAGERLGCFRALFLCAYCMHNEREPGRAAELYGESRRFLTEDERRLRASALYMQAMCIGYSAVPDWQLAERLAREAADIFWSEGDRQGHYWALQQLRKALLGREAPDTAAALEICRRCVELVPSAVDMLWLVMALDLAGLYEEGDEWSARIDHQALSEDLPRLAEIRLAQLSLRAGDLQKLALFAEPRASVPQHIRLALLSSIALAAVGRMEDAEMCLSELELHTLDVAWARLVATGVLGRSAPSRTAEYLALLSRLRITARESAGLSPRDELPQHAAFTEPHELGLGEAPGEARPLPA